MKPLILSLLVFAVTTSVAGAREILAPELRLIDKVVNLVVVAKPISTHDTAEVTNLPRISPDVQVVGVSSEFKVIYVLKGDPSLKQVVVHHYRPPNSPDRQGKNDWYYGVNLASFDPKASTRYLLLLKRESDDRYAPFDQADPATTSILKLNDPKWAKMNLADFKQWLDAQKWLSEQGDNPVFGWTDLSPDISAAGRGEGSLHEAAYNGKLEKARALIQANPSLVNSQASYGSVTPLQLAAESGHKDVAELLLANHADVEAKSYGGWTALLNAVFGGHQYMVEFLLTNKADMSVKDMAGRTPLHVAAENGYTDIAALLLANQADPNVKNHDGDTPLHIAVALDCKGMVELLLAHKAEINAKNDQGKTPLDYAVSHSNNDLAAFLRQHGGLE